MEASRAKLMEVVASLGTAKFEAPEVAVAEVIRRMEAGDATLVLLDTRSEEERAVSTIPGAISTPEFEADPAKYADKEVVCFCTVGYLSAAAACGYRRGGHTNVKNMGDGALLGYTLAKTSAGSARPLVKPDGVPTNEVHTFMPDLAPLAGEGMVAKTFADPGAVLAAANERIAATLGL